MSTHITEHFTLEELTRSDVATRLGIDNTPKDNHLASLKLLCEHVLEPVRAHFGPVRINSGYRSLSLNMSINPMTSTINVLSKHCLGQAADFEIDGVPNGDVAKWCVENLPEFHQVILEYYIKGQPNSGWVHVSYVPGDQKKKVLTASRIDGRVVYQTGLIT